MENFGLCQHGWFLKSTIIHFTSKFESLECCGLLKLNLQLKYFLLRRKQMVWRKCLVFSIIHYFFLLLVSMSSSSLHIIICHDDLESFTMVMILLRRHAHLWDNCWKTWSRLIKSSGLGFELEVLYKKYTIVFCTSKGITCSENLWNFVL